MKNYRSIAMAFVTAAVLAGCASVPESNSLLDQARSAYSDAQANPQVTLYAGAELRQAGDSLDRANNAWNKREDNAVVNHLAYVARQQVAVAQATARQRTAEMAVANANAERDRVRLEARTREVDLAQRSAQASQLQAEASQRNAEALQRQSEASLRSAEDAQRQAAAERQAAIDAHLTAQAALKQTQDAEGAAQAARQQALDAESRARQLEAALKDMEAKKTDRGIVITLGDVLFDTNQAKLKPSGLRSLQKLADFSRQFPQRRFIIEGFTDSTGSAGRNQELSEQRAFSVRVALLDMGVSADRITARGFGENNPVASNDSPAGRQLNRRVEIIISDDNGRIVSR